MQRSKAKKNANGNQRRRVVSRRSDAGRRNGFNKRAAFTTDSTYVGAISIPAGTGQFRVDIIPTLDLFPIDATATRFQTYKVHSIRYKLLPRFNVSSLPGTLPIIYTVPVQSNQLPTATSAAFTAFADCTV